MTEKQEGEVGVGKGRKSREREKKRKIVKLDSLKQLNLNAGGLDIGAAEIYAAVPEGRDEESVRQFETFTADLNSWLTGWKRVGWIQWRWNQPACTGYQSMKSWRSVVSIYIW